MSFAHVPDLPWLDLVGMVFRFLTFLFAATFIVRYSRRPWRSLPEGRHLMGFTCLVAAFMLWSLVNNIAAWLDPQPPTIRPDGKWPGRELVACVLFGFTAWYMYKRNTLLNPQRDAREAVEAENDLHDDRIEGISETQELSEAVHDLASAVRDDDSDDSKV